MTLHASKMTCLLTLPPLLTNPFSEGDVDKQRSECEHFGYNWINPNQGHSEMSNEQRCSDAYHVETCLDASIPHGKGIPNNICKGDIKDDSYNKPCEANLIDIQSDREISYHNNYDDKLPLYDNDDKVMDHSNARDHGIKRKVDSNESTIDYIPSKRISPFLNTPKQRKDERKKILKMSIRKIRQLSDPEKFLRRTVLVNNTMKRLQSELRDEKCRNKKRKSFNMYDVPTNNCLSDSYLCDDPFLSGVNEEITDDMTETLINNVLRDKPNDKNKKELVGGKSNTESNNMDISEDIGCVNSRLEKQLSGEGGKDLYKCSDEESKVFMMPLKDNCKFSCVNYRTDCKEIGVCGTSESNETFCYD